MKNTQMNNDESFGKWCDNCHSATGNCDCAKGSCVECDDYRMAVNWGNEALENQATDSHQPRRV